MTIYNILIHSEKYADILAGELTYELDRPKVVNALLSSWARDRCPSFWHKTYLIDDNLRFSFSDKYDALCFWKHWICPKDLQEYDIFVIDDIKDSANAIKWIKNEAGCDYEFFMPFSGINVAVLLRDKEAAVQFKLTYVNE